MRPRNVLFVVIDQLRADCLFGELAGHVNLPNLRALADGAVSFTRHRSVTSPCGPARASLLTGQYAMNHRATRNGTPLPHDRPNIATEMRKGGWLPLLYGYTDISPDPRVHAPGDPELTSYERVIPGFDEILEMRLEESWAWRAHLASRGYDVPPYPDIFKPSGPAIDDPAIYRAEDSDTAFLADRTIADLTARPQGWLAHVTFIRPHPPFVAPEPYNRMYPPSDLPPPFASADRDAERAIHPFNAAAQDARGVSANVEGFPELDDRPSTVATLRSVYLGLATEVDIHVGRIMDALKAAGRWDDTMVVVTGDHGEMLGDRHLWGKMTYHDAAFHVPLIIRIPGMERNAGLRVDAPTESIDVAPTILDAAGLDIPDTMDGQSLVPFIENGIAETWREAGMSELDFGNPVEPTGIQRALGLPADCANLAILRDRGHTLVHFNGGLPPLLFEGDATGDPDRENRDMASDPGAAKILLDLYRKLLDLRMARAEGRFARTIITPRGAVRVARSGNAAVR